MLIRRIKIILFFSINFRNLLSCDILLEIRRRDSIRIIATNIAPAIYKYRFISLILFYSFSCFFGASSVLLIGTLLGLCWHYITKLSQNGCRCAPNYRICIFNFPKCSAACFCFIFCSAITIRIKI